MRKERRRTTNHIQTETTRKGPKTREETGMIAKELGTGRLKLMVNFQNLGSRRRDDELKGGR
jgi:hypothetical protein